MTRDDDAHAADLLRRVAQGDELAVQACIDRFGPLVWSLARRMAADMTDAEDAVQEVFLDLWSSAVRFDRSKATAVTFVGMIARRRLIDRWRKRRREPSSEPIDVAAEVAASRAPDLAEQSEDVRRAADAISELPESRRQVLQLAVVRGWTHRKISEALDMPLGTVKTHVRRGLQKVRERLGVTEAERR